MGHRPLGRSGTGPYLGPPPSMTVVGVGLAVAVGAAVVVMGVTVVVVGLAVVMVVVGLTVVVVGFVWTVVGLVVCCALALE